MLREKRKCSSSVVTILIIVICVVYFLELTHPTYASGNFYYVDSVSGDDNNVGSSTNSAWKTLSKVNATTFQPGDRILFKRGSSWNGMLNPKGSGTSSNPIIVDCYGEGGKPIINGVDGVTTLDYEAATILLKNQEYWTIKNLEITNENGLTGVKVLKTTSGVTSGIKLEDLTIHNVNGEVPSGYDEMRTGGICIDNATTVAGKYDDLLIDGCEVYDVSQKVGIQHSQGTNPENSSFRSTNTVIRNTIVHDVANHGLVWRTCNGALIEYTTVYRTCSARADGGSGANLWIKYNDGTILQYTESYECLAGANKDAQGYDFDVDVDNSILQYSYSHDNNGGFFLNCSFGGPINDGNVIRYNISENDRLRAFTHTGNIKNTKYYNNTIYASSDTEYEYVFEKYSDVNCYNNVFSNNIFSIHDNNFVYQNQAGLSWDNNCFDGTHPSSEPNDPNKITGNPKFVNADSGSNGIDTVDGYKLQIGSSCINEGKFISNNGGKDYWGNTLYNSSPDVGAHEYQGNFQELGLKAQWNYNEGAGTIANDSTGNGYSGILNGPTWVGSNNQYKLDFDGIDDYVNISNKDILNNVKATTLTGWVKIRDTSQAANLIFISTDNSDVLARAHIEYRPDKTLKAGGRSTDTETYQYAQTMSTITLWPEWTFMAVVIDYEHDLIKIYMNGEKEVEQSVNFLSTSTPSTDSSCVNIGAQEFGQSKALNGEMNDVRVYTRTLSDNEILSLFNNGGE